MKYVYLLIFLLFPASIFSQTTGNLYYLSSTTGAACYEIEYHNNMVYAGAGNTLMVYNLDANGTPDSVVYQERLPSTIVDIRFRNDIMIIAVNHAGLYTYDVSSGVDFVDSYQPVSNDEAAYDIAFKGSDTIFVAYKSKMARFTVDAAGYISFVDVFAQQVTGTYVMGCDVKNNLLAFVTGAFDATVAGNSRTGVHLCDAITPTTEYSFHQQDTCDPHDVIFGQNTDLLHVMGGTESWATTNAIGIYYALNVANPNTPTLAFHDILPYNFFFNIAQPMNGELRNDTLFIATEGAWDNAQSVQLYGHVFVYDATSNNMTFVNELYAGLWHFDLALNGNRMYVASEWYGIKTVDITNIMSEIDLGNTLTGGWNMSSDVYGDRLAVGNEGYGFKYYDFSNPLNPQYLRSKNDTGFCQGIHFSQDGSQLYGWYYTDADFRVHDTTSNFPVVGTLAMTTLADYHDPYVYNNLAIAEQVIPGIPPTHYFTVVDVSNPALPFEDTTILIGNAFIARDICVSDSFLFAVTTGQIKVYNMEDNYTMVTSINSPAFQTFECMALLNDTVYVYIAGLNPNGIRKYYFNGTSLTSISPANVPLTGAGKPKFLALDSFGLYASYQEDGLYAYNKNSLAETGHYRNSMEYYRPDNWGQQQLFCEDGYILDVEYQGQTSILTMNSTSTSTPAATTQPETGTLQPFPNPVRKGNELTITNPMWSTQGVCEIYNAQGQIVSRQNLNGNPAVKISTAELQSGVYFVTITNGMFDTYTGKFIVE
jgi:hypothetical protein